MNVNRTLIGVVDSSVEDSYEEWGGNGKIKCAVGEVKLNNLCFRQNGTCPREGIG